MVSKLCFSLQIEWFIMRTHFKNALSIKMDITVFQPYSRLNNLILFEIMYLQVQIFYLSSVSYHLLQFLLQQQVFLWPIFININLLIPFFLNISFIFDHINKIWVTPISLWKLTFLTPSMSSFSSFIILPLSIFDKL